MLSRTPEELLIELREIYKRGLAAGAPDDAEMAAILRRSIEHLEKHEDVNGAMREFLPFVQTLAAFLPAWDGFKLMFIYRLTMMEASFKSAFCR